MSNSLFASAFGSAFGSADVVAFFLGLSLLLYCLFAGADFGGGILEAFVTKPNKREQREVISHAIGPVWEANHVWLILAVVILFVAFPKAYATLSISFHIPLTLMLIGIIVRGCAFTFRHYDAVKGRSQRYYAWAFVISSYLTPLMMGMIAGGLMLGRVRSPTTLPLPSFTQAFLDPWLTWFSFAVGLFTGSLFAFLAAVYLIGETSDENLRAKFFRRAVAANGVAFVSGAFVFLAAELEGLPLTALFWNHPPSAIMVATATLLLIPLWWSLRRLHVNRARVFVAMQVACILLGWIGLQYPILIHSQNEVPLSIYTTAAPPATLAMLLSALIVGCLLIFPALIYLLRIFKRRPV